MDRVNCFFTIILTKEGITVIESVVITERGCVLYDRKEAAYLHYFHHDDISSIKSIRNKDR